MSSQATVHSVEALKSLRSGMALYGEDTLAALGAVSSEVRRTVLWLEQNRPAYWHDQIKRRREQVSMAKAEVFRRKLQKRPDYTPADERAGREPSQGRGQPARGREAAHAGPQVAATVPARRPRVPRQRPAPQGYRRDGYPQCRPAAGPDRRVDRGLPAGPAAFGDGTRAGRGPRLPERRPRWRRSRRSRHSPTTSPRPRNRGAKPVPPNEAASHRRPSMRNRRGVEPLVEPQESRIRVDRLSDGLERGTLLPYHDRVTNDA